MDISGIKDMHSSVSKGTISNGLKVMVSETWDIRMSATSYTCNGQYSRTEVPISTIVGLLILYSKNVLTM